MKLTYKLFALPIIVLLSLIYISFLFSSEIDSLKKKIDNIYFGTFVPVHKLHIIKENYKNILTNTNETLEKSRDIILENWNYYNGQYKTKKERIVVQKIDATIKKSFKKNDKRFYEYLIKQIDLLIQYEVSSAASQRKTFLQQYNKIQNYLFYNQIFVIVFIILFIVIVVLGAVKNKKQLEDLVDKYKSDSITDGLTNLYNRKYFDTMLDEMKQISKQNSWTSAFIMIDIDFFKQYNDTYGHDAGDKALQSVAKVLSTVFSEEYDYVFRLGGEEFGVLVFNIDQARLEKRLKLLQSGIAAQHIKHIASKTGFLTLSLGVVLVDEELYNNSRTEIYKMADKKLYYSKENGRDRYTI